jgi:anti-anti-sigma factor
MKNATFRLLPALDSFTTVIAAFGEIDIAASKRLVGFGMMALSDLTTTRVEIDLAEVTFFDASAISAMVRLRSRADELNKRVVLIRVPPVVLRVLTLTDGTHPFDCHFVPLRTDDRPMIIVELPIAN